MIGQAFDRVFPGSRIRIGGHVKITIASAVCVTGLAVLLTGCGGSESATSSESASAIPQACKELSKSAAALVAATAALASAPDSDQAIGDAYSAADDFAQTAQAVAETPSAREEGLDSVLADTVTKLSEGTFIRLYDPDSGVEPASDAARVDEAFLMQWSGDVEAVCGFPFMSTLY
jgi:hypothetical protein